jgi:hypothetical protein
VAPAVLVESRPEPRRHARRLALAAHVADRAGRAGTATAAGVLAFPGPILVALADPPTVLAARTRHQANNAAPLGVIFT